MKVVVAGGLPLAEDWLSLCVQAGHSARLFLVETLHDVETARALAGDAALADVAPECHNETNRDKRRVSELLAQAPAL